jgi:hypothetical protein
MRPSCARRTIGGMRRGIVLAAAGFAAVMVGTSARADAPPVTHVPQGRLATVVTTKGELFAIALPRRRAGLVWRLASRLDPQVLRERAEADAGRQVVVIYEAVGSGVAALSYGLTRGERQKAVEGRQFLVVVL